MTSYYYQLASGEGGHFEFDSEDCSGRELKTAELRAKESGTTLSLLYGIDDRGERITLVCNPKVGEVWKTHSGRIALIVRNYEFPDDDNIGLLYYDQQDRELICAKIMRRLQERVFMTQEEWFKTVQQLDAE